MISETEQDRPICTFFLFINSGSGGGLGEQVLSQEIGKIQFTIPIRDEKDIQRVDVHFINMRKKRDQGFQKLRQLNEEKKRTIAIVCGGDGTVMWVVSQFVKHKIDPMDTPLGIIPLGTGNDFSQSLNWGKQKTMLLEKNYRSLKKLIRKWLHAKVSLFDIWDVSAQVFPNGKFEKVENGDNKQLEEKIFNKTFCNYFSFGIDGKIGYSFDMHRANSRLGNLAMYGLLGMVKTATKTKTLDELLQTMQLNEDAEVKMKESFKPLEKSVIFKSKHKSQTEKQQNKKQQKDQSRNDDKQAIIADGYLNLLMLNIDSFTGGVKGIWENAKQMFNKKENHSQPSYSDGKLEVVSFGSSMGLVLERSFGGFARRITQGGGPFLFTFRRYEKEEKHRTYLQIDGQFIRFTHPKSLLIRHSAFVPNGKIKVIEHDPDFTPFIPTE